MKYELNFKFNSDEELGIFKHSLEASTAICQVLSDGSRAVCDRLMEVSNEEKNLSDEEKYALDGFITLSRFLANVSGSSAIFLLKIYRAFPQPSDDDSDDD